MMSTPDEQQTATHPERRVALDRDLVAVLGTVAILLLTALCFLGSAALPR